MEYGPSTYGDRELDLMARLADLQLRARWNDWDKSAFTATSRSHVSVYAHSARR